MIKIVPDSQTQVELEPNYRPTVIEPNFSKLPFHLLGDRQFELLSYSLIKKEIHSRKLVDFDDVAIMQGVGERGRDCVLYLESKVRGLVQCKKYEARLTKPQVLKEIIKFLMFACNEPTILPDPDNFKYFIFASNDFTEPAIDLLHQYSVTIEAEIKAGTIDQYVGQIAEEYESFRGFRTTPPFDKVRNLVSRIAVLGVNGVDLTNRVNEELDILKNFFNVKTVVSIDDADKVLRKALEDYGLKFLTDDALRKLQSRISIAHPDHRVSLGMVDFYGYSLDFFKSLNNESLKEILMSVASTRMTIDGKLMDFVHEEIRKRVFTEITRGLLHMGRIHPFSVGLAAPYLHKRMTPLLSAGNIPDALTDQYVPERTKSSEQIVEEVSKILLATSERIMAGDYSQVVGDAQLIELKRKLFNHMHQGLQNIDAARARLKIDLPVMLPALEKIETELKQLLSETRTVVIGDSSFFDDKEKLGKIVQTFGQLTPVAQQTR
ncbi:hypothetical protein K6W78_01150 [Burkholderia cepacia]|uniref:hypothetical protein n=1 Tax=Burkholderia cepacia TaxID=292 RepID=UPI001C967D82|nr:hypothetical protein [Burkholderia cepacia]MBY4798620.1 hypothetical protein [Burkholderia cepacia]